MTDYILPCNHYIQVTCPSQVDADVGQKLLPLLVSCFHYDVGVDKESE